MKALSLTQPWAHAIAVGSKRVETRSWSTEHRGLVAIHAALRHSKTELVSMAANWMWCGALGWTMGDNSLPWNRLQFGKIIAIANLIDCRPTESFTVGEIDDERGPDASIRPEYRLYRWCERDMGDFSAGRFGFVLANVRRLVTPIECKGALGFWTVPDSIEMAIREELAA